MRRFVLSSLIVAVAIAAAITVIPAGADGFKVRTVHRPAVTWSGSYSEIKIREFHRITNEADWRALWERHAGDAAERDSYDAPVVPAIDFEHFMVLAHFRGKAWNTRSEQLIEYVEYDTHIQVKFDANTYQTASIVVGAAEIDPGSARRTAKAADTEDDPNHTSSYALWLMPRSTKAITIEENVQGLKNEPPKWRVQRTFDELKDAQANPDGR